jgi:hypothetical protein
LTESRSHHPHGSSKRPVIAPTSGSPSRAEHKEAATAPAKAEWRIVDDRSDTIPATRAETEVLETFLGKLLDEIIGGIMATVSLARARGPPASEQLKPADHKSNRHRGQQ